MNWPPSTPIRLRDLAICLAWSALTLFGCFLFRTMPCVVATVPMSWPVPPIYRREGGTNDDRDDGDCKIVGSGNVSPPRWRMPLANRSQRTGRVHGSRKSQCFYFPVSCSGMETGRRRFDLMTASVAAHEGSRSLLILNVSRSAEPMIPDHTVLPCKHFDVSCPLHHP